MRVVLRPNLWLPPIALMVVIFLLSAQPLADPDLSTLEVALRKLGHLCGYALLSALWFRALASNLDTGRAALAAFAISSLYGASDELHQTFVEGRSGTPVDWAIDTAGAALGVLVVTRFARPGVAA